VAGVAKTGTGLERLHHAASGGPCRQGRQSKNRRPPHPRPAPVAPEAHVLLKRSGAAISCGSSRSLHRLWHTEGSHESGRDGTKDCAGRRNRKRLRHSG